MSEPFLKQVADYIVANYKDYAEKLCIVLPNKRGALFLKNNLAQSFGKTIWLPRMLSAEEAVEELSGLKLCEEVDLICLLYESYKACYAARAENFEGFARWGTLMLQDFNEIDRSLANPAQLYENLKDIKEIENWSLGQEPLSPQQQAYIEFMSSMGAIYRHFTTTLIQRGIAYLGLAYRQAVSRLEETTFANTYHKILFCGFNALNPAELKIFNRFVNQKKADLLWDADAYYLDDSRQEAGLFMRINLETFHQKDTLFIGQHFKQPKKINIVSVPKQMGQAQIAKQRVEALIDRGISPDKIAIVLANEKLLWPVLQQLPQGISSVNITMEYPLKYSSAYSILEQLLHLQMGFLKQNKSSKVIYHKDFVSLLRQPLLHYYFKASGTSINPNEIARDIAKRNLSFLSTKILRQLFGNQYELMAPLVEPAPNPKTLNNFLLEFTRTLIDYLDAPENKNNAAILELEYLNAIHKTLNRLDELTQKFPYFGDLASYRQLFLQVTGSAAVPFVGEPLSGLQIMGVLETRNLDFDYLILLNVNEGVIPSGKTINSFIPNDLKRAFGLPLYFEKDAIYAYHFYRLLQRAKEVVITYDSETDSFGKGEKSRFVTQLELELKNYNPNIEINNEIATYSELPPATDKEIFIEKTNEALEPVLEKATNMESWGGLSPSGLISYKECPLRFYFRYGAKLTETEEVEESADAGTFGSVLHLSLEELYKDFTGQILLADTLNHKLEITEEVVERCFTSFFDNEKLSGKNLLQQEVIGVYVKKLIRNDIRLVEKLDRQKQNIRLSGLEQEFSATLNVGSRDLIVKGKIDRIDISGAYVRVIDYKSSVKDSDKFAFEGFKELFTNKDYNKQLQLLLYAWLLHKNNFCAPQQLLPCIIPFKVFSEEPKYMTSDGKKRLEFSPEFLMEFEAALSEFISEIFDPAEPFRQTNDKKTCEYCAYKTICNR